MGGQTEPANNWVVPMAPKIAEHQRRVHQQSQNKYAQHRLRGLARVNLAMAAVEEQGEKAYRQSSSHAYQDRVGLVPIGTKEKIQSMPDVVVKVLEPKRSIRAF